MSKIRHTSIAPTRTADHHSGERIDRHRHDEHQIMYASAGVVEATTERGSWIAPPQRAVWVPAGEWHEHRFHGATRSHTVGFPRDDAPLDPAEPAVVLVTPLLRELIISWADGTLCDAELDRVRAVTYDQLRRATHGSLHVPRPRNPVLVAACEVVQADLMIPWTADRLAAEVGVSGRTLSRLFRSELTMSYPQWRTQARLAHAVRRLAEGHTVTEAARDCGWSSPSAFIDVYRRNLGHTPGQGQLRPRAAG
ncbi:AraC family transcriptional regulator [Solicola gregarius]|uniref:HTH-type transcriptional regulator RipA n=1 Tax=Solicola gregarius TaxID=2908642 RepID=A0AA46TE38_9ACTN|nr:helix-turn-helix transcriptional regulator [Solicola gregarius]UYM03520.1 helix-turn-helix transcriptional regulator [Solicola gregarius]